MLQKKITYGRGLGVLAAGSGGTALLVQEVRDGGTDDGDFGEVSVWTGLEIRH